MIGTEVSKSNPEKGPLHCIDHRDYALLQYKLNSPVLFSLCPTFEPEVGQEVRVAGNLVHLEAREGHVDLDAVEPALQKRERELSDGKAGSPTVIVT